MITATELIFYTAAAFLAAAVGGVIFSVIWMKKIGEKQGEIKRGYERIQKALKKLDIVESVKGEILNSDDIEKQVDIIDAGVARFLSGVADPDKRALTTKVLVNFYRNPRDVRSSELQNAMITLLRKQFHILWAYSNTGQVPNFADEMRSCINLRDKDQERLVMRCGFLEMTKDEKALPISFSVVAPLESQHTTTYITFPEDKDLNFCLRIDHHSVLADDINAIAVKCIARVQLHDPSGQPTWCDLRQAAIAWLNN